MCIRDRFITANELVTQFIAIIPAIIHTIINSLAICEFILPKAMRVSTLFLPKNITFSDITTVSYTHLDTYLWFTG